MFGHYTVGQKDRRISCPLVRFCGDTGMLPNPKLAWKRVCSSLRSEEEIEICRDAIMTEMIQVIDHGANSPFSTILDNSNRGNE